MRSWRALLARLALTLVALALFSGCCCMRGGFDPFRSPAAAPARGAIENEPRREPTPSGTLADGERTRPRVLGSAPPPTPFVRTEQSLFNETVSTTLRPARRRSGHAGARVLPISHFQL